jgi:hypothetical protein
MKTHLANGWLIKDKPGITVEFECRFQQKNGRKKISKEKTVHDTPPPNFVLHIPQTAKLLALAYYYQKLIDDDVVKNYADIARITGNSRARITQIINLTILAPQIQQEILCLNGKKLIDYLKEQNLRIVLKSLVWQEQVEIWEGLKNTCL